MIHPAQGVQRENHPRVFTSFEKNISNKREQNIMLKIEL